MRYSLIICCCLLGLAASQAQPTRVYPAGPNIVLADGAGTVLSMQSAASVQVMANASEISVRYPGASPLYLSPANFLSRTGVPYGATAPAALSAYVASLLSAGSASFGSVQPVITDYTGPSGAIATTDVVKLLIENVGSSGGTLTYGGAVYSMGTGEQREFRAELDPTSGKLIPLLSVSLDATGTTLRVIKYLRQ